MFKSEQINELATALSKVQSEMKAAKKEAENPFFKSKYADLTSVWEACRDPLSKNGLSICQTMESTEKGEGVRTTLLHTSGQWMSGVLTLNPVKNDPQGVGSAITYARRYALASIVGVMTEDDDGNAASTKPETPKTVKSVPVPMRKSQALESFENSLPPIDEEEAHEEIGSTRTSEGDQCVTCGQGTMKLRKGPKGNFLGCSKFPNCKNTAQLATV